MAKWRVINMHPNQLTHKEMFKGELLSIPYGKHVLMDYEDAVQFRGQYFPMLKTAEDQPDPRGFKVIKLEPHDENEIVMEAKVDKFICQIDGKSFDTEKELNDYINKNHSDKIFKDEMLEKELEKDLKLKRGK